MSRWRRLLCWIGWHDLEVVYGFYGERYYRCPHCKENFR